MLCKYILYNNYIEINTCNTNTIVFDIHENSCYNLDSRKYGLNI